MNDVQPFALGRQTSEPVAAISGLEKLGERVSRRLRAIIEPYGGARPLVTALPLEETMFMMWDASAPEFASLSLYRLHPIKGPVVLRIDAPLVSLLVDRFYGGKGDRASSDKREFTPTETRLGARLADGIIAALVECWAEIAPLEPALINRETNPAHAQLMPGETAIVVQGFEVDMGDHRPRIIEFIYPKAGFGGLEIVGSPKAGDEARPADPVWRTRLATRLDDVRFPVRTVLARPNLKMAELMSLKPGDVIPIHIARQLPLLVGDRVFAQGTVGEQDGSAAFMIEKLA
ncbi:flagellar motor switch protein FliM [Sphingobium sp. B1D7B]|uniref:flagellar motor switch protein FliM n=1 Tax=Sphingobium sp. B1D7B TaxID=2940578 RepID=UPI0022259C49|nr:flagellar motor switch protein FliM [Sphingobium sp. B1D7B]MCW2404251.1 flagellar motor switch protein FliM [Sphingobium sp. B1D7B]